MAQKYFKSFARLKTWLVGKRPLALNVAQQSVDYLLFPILCWLALLAAAHFANGSFSLIPTFFLPLVQLFFVYRLVGLLAYLFLGQETYELLVRRFFLPLMLTYMAMQGIGLFADLSLLGSTELFVIANTQVTLRILFIASIGLYLWLTGIHGISQLFRRVLTQKMQVDEGSLEAYLILLRYFLIGFGLFVAISELKPDPTAIAAVSGGLAVGVGFGLREVVVNFVSGIMLLFERSLRPGDVIEIDNKLGRVEDINIRATTIRTIDNVELVIPNQLFLTSTLTSYTRKSRVARFQLEVPASCAHDPETVIAVLLHVVRSDPKVLISLNSEVEVAQLGDASVQYKLQVWTEHPLDIADIRSNLYQRIWKAFEENQIGPVATAVAAGADPSEQETIDLVKDAEFEGPARLAQSKVPSKVRKFPLDRGVAPQERTPPAANVPSQIDLVERSFEKIKPNAVEFSASFYQNLFRNYPKVRPLFSRTDMKKQQAKLVDSLILLVENIRNPDALRPVLRDLGARHQKYGVIEKHYPAVGIALVETFAQYLKEDWTEEVQQAWVATYQVVAQIMIEGTREVQSQRALLDDFK